MKSLYSTCIKNSYAISLLCDNYSNLCYSRWHRVFNTKPAVFQNRMSLIIWFSLDIPHIESCGMVASILFALGHTKSYINTLQQYCILQAWPFSVRLWWEFCFMQRTLLFNDETILTLGFIVTFTWLDVPCNSRQGPLWGGGKYWSSALRGVQTLQCHDGCSLKKMLVWVQWLHS